MSTVKVNAAQIGQSVTATNNFTWYQPASPDGTVRLGNGNSGSVTDLVTLTSAGNLGIGTTSPTVLRQKNLEVSSSGTNDGAAVIVGKRGTGIATVRLTGLDTTVGTDINFNFPNTGDFSFFDRAASATRLTLDSSGNLGLGVTPSAWGSSRRAIQISSVTGICGDNAAGQFTNNAYFGASGATYITTNPATYYQQYAGGHYWYNAPSGTAGNAISFTQAMTLDAGGNLIMGGITSAVGYGNFANAAQSATLSANSLGAYTAKSWDSTYRVAASNAATVDVWLARDAAGSVIGNNAINGYFYILVTGNSGANAFSAIYSLVTTGNGTSQATLALVSSVTRGTSPVSTVTIANDGGSGAVKLQVTYINNSGVVGGGASNVVFKGLLF